MDKQEIEFKGSNLESTLKSTKNIQKYHDANLYALECQPKSKFWQEAVDFSTKLMLQSAGVEKE